MAKKKTIEPVKTERLETMLKGFPVSQKHYSVGNLEPIREMQLTASKRDLKAYIRLTAYVYIKRAGFKEGEDIYKEVGKIATYFSWERALFWDESLSGVRVPSVEAINKALRIFNLDTLTPEEQSFIRKLSYEENAK